MEGGWEFGGFDFFFFRLDFGADFNWGRDRASAAARWESIKCWSALREGGGGVLVVEEFFGFVVVLSEFVFVDLLL